MRDVGGLFLATGFILLVAAVHLERRIVLLALISYLLFAIPHAIWHFTLEPTGAARGAEGGRAHRGGGAAALARVGGGEEEGGAPPSSPWGLGAPAPGGGGGGWSRRPARCPRRCPAAAGA